MRSKRLQYLLRSKSLNFVRDLKDKNHSIRSYKWNDNQVFYRSSLNGMTLIYEILLKTKYKSEYFSLSKLNPKVIFDDYIDFELLDYLDGLGFTISLKKYFTD